MNFLLRYPAGLLWNVGSDLHRQAYEKGIFPRRALPKPVVSIGNWTMGGTGKTPFADFLLDLAKQKNKTAVVLSRGYGRHEGADIKEVLLDSKAAEVGDEPLLLKHHHPQAPIFVGRSRFQAGQKALEKYQPDFFLLDDGFQHHQLQRRLNIVLVDSTQGPGKHKIFPIGWARESRDCLKYADWVVHTKTNLVDPEVLGLRQEWLKSLLPNPQRLLTAEYRFAGYFDQHDNKVEAVKPARVMALAGIAHPDVFFKGIRQDFNLVEELPFSDHQIYSTELANVLVQKIVKQKIQWLVVTEKDWVKLKDFASLYPYLLVAKRKMFIEDTEAFHAFCAQVFA